MTNRSRRHTSRGRPSAKPSSRARRSRAMRSSSSAGDCQCRALVQRRAGRPGRRDTMPSAGSGGLGRVVRPGAARRSTLKRNRSSSPQPSSGVRSARDDAQVVGGVVGGPQHHEQVAHGPGGVDERARLGPVRDAGPPRGRPRGTGSDVRAGHEDRDVAEPARAPAPSPAALSCDLPALGERGGDRRGRRRGLGRAHARRRGVPCGWGSRADHGHRRARPAAAPRCGVEVDVVGLRGGHVLVGAAPRAGAREGVR